MIKSERLNRILTLVAQRGFASLEDISREIAVSESTVRRDIVELDREGKLTRERGGASGLRTASFRMVDQKLIIREKIEGEAKTRIAKRALELLEPGMTVYIDAGSTTLTMAKLLPNGFPITVVTNSFSLAHVVAERNISTYLIGGLFKLTTDATVGPIAEEFLGHFHFRYGFMGANAVDPGKGFMTPDVSEAAVKRQAIASSETPVFLVDRTKFDSQSVVAFAPLKGATAITDYIDRAQRYPGLKIMEVEQ